MREVVLYIAMSLDGYLADESGGVGWLEGQDSSVETPDTYSAFIENVDTVIMGGKTYRQVQEELSPDVWAYQGLMTYVVTRQRKPDQEEIRFTREDPCTLISRLKGEPGKKIWICGGAELIRQLRNADLIDVYDITVIPTLLGRGIRLFEENKGTIPLELLHHTVGNGMVELVYRRRGDGGGKSNSRKNKLVV